MGRDTREIWAKRVERWADSGLTAAEFASEAGVNPRTLTFWKWRLRSVKAPAAKKQPVVDRRPAFVELIGSSSGAADDSATLEIILRDGVRVRVPAGADEATLKRVVGVLEAR